MLLGDVEGLPESLARLTTTGLLAGERKERVERFLDGAVVGGLLRATDDSYRTLSLTPEGRAVMAGKVAEVVLPLPDSVVPKAARGPKKRTTKARAGTRARGEAVSTAVGDVTTPLDPGLLDALRAWRHAEASRRKVPTYVVFHNRTLEAIAQLRPSSLAALASISGVGPAKLEAYGAAVLAIVAGR